MRDGNGRFYLYGNYTPDEEKEDFDRMSKYLKLDNKVLDRYGKTIEQMTKKEKVINHIPSLQGVDETYIRDVDIFYANLNATSWEVRKSGNYNVWENPRRRYIEDGSQWFFKC